MPFTVAIEGTRTGEPVIVRITRDPGYKYIGQDMDEENGRYLLAFYEQDRTDPGGTDVLEFQTRTPGASPEPHWVLALAIAGSRVIGHDRKQIEDGHA